MSLSRFPLPSIHHVLEAELHEILSRPPSVITVLEYDQPDWSPSTATSTSTFPTASIGYIPSASHLMKTIDLRDAEPISRDDDEQFSFVVHFPGDDELKSDGNADIDAQTIFKEKRPSIARGLRRGPERDLGRSNAKDSAKHDFSLVMIKTVRKVLPAKIAEALLRRTNRH